MVIWTDPARADLRQIFQFIAQNSRYFASKTIEEIIVHSYRIIYEVTENETCVVLAVVHAKRDLSTDN